MHPSADTGRVIAGRYRLQAPIGRGAMGVVWRARDQLLDRDVAIKEVQIADSLTEGERATAFQRTLREAKTAARLNHPAVVTVYDVAEDGGRPWIVMQLVHAQSLDQMLAASGPLSPRRAAEMARQLLSALSVAHAAGVMHRDVKPSNVLLGSDDRAVLTDFGIATFADDPKLTQTGMVMGSPGFTAPERIRGEDASPASDLWSLGATDLRGGRGTRPVRAARRGDHHHVRDHQRGRAPGADGGRARPGHRGAAPPRARRPAGRHRGRADDRRRAAAAGRPRARFGARLRGHRAVGVVASAPTSGGFGAPRIGRARIGRARIGRARIGVAARVGLSGIFRGGPAADAAAGRELDGLRADGDKAARPVGREHRPAGWRPGVGATPPRPRLSRRSRCRRRRAAGGRERAPGTARPALRVRRAPRVRPGPRPGRRAGQPDFSSWYNQSPRSGASSPPASGSGYPPPAGYAPAAWSGQASQQQPPPWSGAEYAPSRPRRSGFGWKAAVAALAIIGAAAGAGTVVLLHQGHSGSQGQGGATGTNSAAGSTSGSSSASLPPSTLQIIDAINKPATGPLPSGFTMISQPAASNETAGFTIAAPTNWHQSTSGYQTYLTDPTDANTNILIDLTPHTYPDMLREAQYIEAQSILHFPGYKRVGMAASNVRGTTGSWWKFTWNKKGVQQEALDLLFVLHTSKGPQSYALYVTAPESKFDQMRPIFDEEVETFATLPG